MAVSVGSEVAVGKGDAVWEGDSVRAGDVVGMGDAVGTGAAHPASMANKIIRTVNGFDVRISDRESFIFISFRYGNHSPK